ncbi:hypothetical protein COLO4_35168 [Corchorus olitorius]|uniref:PGG domain-containing protein n=1 Tax=Corchorus olitorius TaxID=93759 RepID=A0A1R3GI09_9ROSI|nr:hypothetical protein COLO4_35168 [Corchorus olitorius]
MAFQAGMNPPGGVWQDTNKDHTAGFSIMADNFPIDYRDFLIYNTSGFVASLSIILLLISGLPLKRRVFMWILMIIMWVAITAMALTYVKAISVFTPDHQYAAALKVIVIGQLVWSGLMLLLLLGYIEIKLLTKVWFPS